MYTNSANHLPSLWTSVDFEDYWKLAPIDQLDLGQLPFLKELQIRINVAKKPGDDQGLAWTESLLRTNSQGTRPNELTKLLVVCDIRPGSQPVAFDAWERIDGVLCGLDQNGENSYEDLSQVSLWFLVSKPSPPTIRTAQASQVLGIGDVEFASAPAILLEAITNCSPLLSKRGLLDIQTLRVANMPERFALF